MKIQYAEQTLKGFNKDWNWLLEVGRGLGLSNVPVSVIEKENYIKRIQEIIYKDTMSASMKEVDGFLGATTIRHLLLIEDKDDNETHPSTSCDYILFGNEKVMVPGVDIVHQDEPGGLSFKKSGGKFGKWKSDPRSNKLVNMLAVIHWDVCFSAPQCFKALLSSGYSSVFGIDNDDGTGKCKVYQWLDPLTNYGYHAGEYNHKSLLSFDLTNAVSTKHADKYKVPRPVIKASPHGDKKEFLGMYDCQIIAMLRILKAVSCAYPRFKLLFPVGKDKSPVETVVDNIGGNSVYSHLHLTENKWDVSGLERQIIELIGRRQDLQREFPEVMGNFGIKMNLNSYTG